MNASGIPETTGEHAGWEASGMPTCVGRVPPNTTVHGLELVITTDTSQSAPVIRAVTLSITGLTRGATGGFATDVEVQADLDNFIAAGCSVEITEQGAGAPSQIAGTGSCSSPANSARYLAEHVNIGDFAFRALVSWSP